METEEETLKDGTREIYIFDDPQDENKKRLIFKIDPKKQTIILYPKPDSFFAKEVLLDGFNKIPDGISDKGYIKAGLEYYFSARFGKIEARTLTISTKTTSTIKKIKSGIHVTLNFEDFKWIYKHFSIINGTAKSDKISVMGEFLTRIFPKYFEYTDNMTEGRAKRVISLLDDSIIEHLQEADLTKILTFVESFINKKYKSDIHKQKLFTTTKLKVDEITINKIIAEFKSLLKKKSSEDDWSKFLRKNLFLFDSKYIKIIEQLVVVLAKARKVDFGMIDTSGYLDLFEIKKPSTPLLSKKTDRGNYYFSAEAVKAITQLEKYLYNAEIKSKNLKADIEREYGDIKVDVVKPRAYLIIGSLSQLDNANKLEDFRVLRRSYKNIEIILFDELLQQMENVKDKIYLN